MLDKCFKEVYDSAMGSLFLPLETSERAASLWEKYVGRVVFVLQQAGAPYCQREDNQLSREEISLKYSAPKATILLAAMPGQYPPLPLPTTSFIHFLLDEVAKYQKSIKTVCHLHLGYNRFTS